MKIKPSLPSCLKVVFPSLFVCFSINLHAQTATAPAFGEGTGGDPYQIETLQNLYWIASNNANWNKHYIQTANIDASETAG